MTTNRYTGRPRTTTTRVCSSSCGGRGEREVTLDPWQPPKSLKPDPETWPEGWHPRFEGWTPSQYLADHNAVMRSLGKPELDMNEYEAKLEAQQAERERAAEVRLIGREHLAQHLGPEPARSSDAWPAWYQDGQDLVREAHAMHHHRVRVASMRAEGWTDEQILKSLTAEWRERAALYRARTPDGRVVGAWHRISHGIRCVKDAGWNGEGYPTIRRLLRDGGMRALGLEWEIEYLGDPPTLDSPGRAVEGFSTGAALVRPPEEEADLRPSPSPEPGPANKQSKKRHPAKTKLDASKRSRPKKAPRTGSQSEPVSCYDDDGALVATYPSRAAAAKAIGRDAASIRKALNNHSRRTAGYRWRSGQAATSHLGPLGS